jgi:hypothetical protein
MPGSEREGGIVSGSDGCQRDAEAMLICGMVGSWRAWRCVVAVNVHPDDDSSSLPPSEDPELELEDLLDSEPDHFACGYKE